MNPMNVTVNLDLYTHGDPEFRRVLASMMISNLKEFQGAISKCMQDHNVIPFKKTYHKCKPAIKFVENPGFREVIEELSHLLETEPQVSSRLSVLEKSYQQWLDAIEEFVSKYS